MCLSGGGFRATLFHLGALRRLNEIGMLQFIDTFSSVSGGSIINGTFHSKTQPEFFQTAILSTSWKSLSKKKFSPEAFDLLVAEPVKRFCDYNFATKAEYNSKF